MRLRGPATLALSLLGCQRPATQIVLRIDSDLRPGTELRGVQVVTRRVGASADGVQRSVDLSDPARTLPGTLALVAGDPQDPRRLEVEVRAALAAGDGFSTRAVVSFEPEQTLVLDVFLASRCRDPKNRAGCGPDETCGPEGCEPVRRPYLPGYAPDAPRPDVVVTRDDATVSGEAGAFDAAMASGDALDPDATVSDGTASDGTVSDGTASDGTASDGTASDGTASDGTASDVVTMRCGPGLSCCAGGAVCMGDTVCTAAGACEACGPGRACCTDGTVCASGTVCGAGGRCVACSAEGQPCCAEGACGANLRCAAGACRCGGPGQPCCRGVGCDPDLACASGTCRGCGARGELCCAAGRCDPGSSCQDGRCAACGALGQPCCGGVCDASSTACARAGCDAGGRCAMLPFADGTACGAVRYGAWSACAFSSLCDRFGSQQRSVSAPRCRAGACGDVTTTETQACSRSTDGLACASTGYGAWGACGGFTSTCDSTGTQSRTVTSYRCASGACASSTSTGTQTCGRTTTNQTCTWILSGRSCPGTCQSSACEPSCGRPGCPC